VVLTPTNTLEISLICKFAQQNVHWDRCAHLGSHSPITKTPPSSFYWGVDASLRYGNAKGRGATVTILNTTSGVIDTGTNLIGLGTGKLLRDFGSYQIRELSHITYVRGV
jgi:hypothetical protein